MNSVTIAAMVLIAVCCIMLATQPARNGGTRRGRRDRPAPREDDPHPVAAAGAGAAGGEPARRATLRGLLHRNRWDRRDLDRVFGQDLDSPGSDVGVWPTRCRCPR